MSSPALGQEQSGYRVFVSKPLGQSTSLDRAGAILSDISYKIMAILKVTANSHFPRRISQTLLLYGPFTPVKGVDCPWCQIVTICRYRGGAVVRIWIRTCRPVRGARVRPRPDIRQTQRRVGHSLRRGVFVTGGRCVFRVIGRANIRCCWTGS